MCTFLVGVVSRIPRVCSVLSLLCVLCFLGSGSKAGADTYTVTNLNDSGAGSLRQAVSDANSRSGADTIVFAPGVTGAITLLSALPTLSDDVAIEGPGANQLKIWRVAALGFRFFLIDGAGSGPTVTLAGLTINNGVGEGGGGAVKNVHGNVTLRNCALTFNRADFSGGGIFNAGTMTLVGCTLDNNQVGGIAGPPPLYKGGGIYNTGTLTLTQSTLGDNNVNVSELTPGQATGQGGGIYNTGDVTLSHCTLAGNYVHIYYSPTIVSSVDEPGEGNAIYNTGSVTLNNTILFQSEVSETKYLGATFSNMGGTVVSHGYNLTDSDTIGLLTGTGDKVATTRVLDPLGLRNNGGPTPTFNPLIGGPAIDAGDPAFTDTSATDQRGRSRVIGGRIDIGAVEFRPSFDFDGDGHNDLLFQNSATGSLVAWYMHGLALQGGMSIGSLPEPGWKVVATDDFNDDGSPDLVFQNTTTKKIVIWFMAGTTYIGGMKLPSPPSNYTVVGAGNFIGTGGPNLVLVDSVSHDIHIWMLNQGTIALDTKLHLPRQDNFPIVAVGDLNQDGYADLLLQNATTGQLVAWYFTGLDYKSGKFLQPSPDPAWKPKAIGDYNNDGSVDIVFQNVTTGKIVLWFMKDLNFQGGDFTTKQPLIPYQIVGSH